MFVTRLVGVGKNVLIHHSMGIPKIKQVEILDFREQVPLVHQGEDFFFVPADQFLIFGFIPVSPAVFHPVFLPEPFYLTMAEHGCSGHGDHHG